jgi:hypothetical protein
MGVRIGKLVCTIRVSGLPARQIQFAPEGPAHPALSFDLPVVQEHREFVSPAQNDEPSVSDASPEMAPKGADPRKVADRVYDLMRREIQSARERGHLDGR